MFELMIFMTCFFVGIVATLFFLARRVDGALKTLTDEHAQLRVLLRMLESRLDDLTPAQDKATAEENLLDAQDQQAQNFDPLLHLSFDKADPAPEAGLTLDPPRESSGLKA